MRMGTWLLPPTVRKYGRPRCGPPMEQQQCSTCRPHPRARLSPSPMVSLHPTPHSFPHFPRLSLSFLSFENRASLSKMFQFYTWSCLHSIRSAGSNTQKWTCLVAWADAVTDALASLAAPQQHHNKLCIFLSSSPVSFVVLFFFFLSSDHALP